MPFGPLPTDNIMENYNDFASIYDLFMDDIPYGKWGGFIKNRFTGHGIDSGLILDLACGSGTLTELFAGWGYDMIGIDGSSEMLDIAINKRDASGHDILYLCQDMRSFELYGTVRGIFCVCDSINYLTDKQDLVKTFSLVNNYLDPGGIFIFDANTDYKYRELIGDSTIAENRSEGSFIWENYYQEDTGINEYDLTLFIKQENGLFKRSIETHYQRGYSPEDIKNAALGAGLVFLEALDSDTMEAPTRESERVFYILQEKGKQK